jgi:hypothetical protein
VLEVDRRAVGPQLSLDLLTRHDLAGARGQKRQHLECLRAQMDRPSPATQLAGAGVQFERAEVKRSHG